MRRILVSAVMLAGALALTATAAGHDFDHPAPPVNPPTAPGGTVLSAPLGAWEHVATIPTGNPHTDIDFFEKGGETYMSAGTLAIGPYGGGQTIIKLTQGGEVPSIPVPGGPPMVVSQHPSASCVSDPNAALSLQHDVEATPKGDVIFSTFNAAADRSDAQLLVDATDAGGRCHDQGTAGTTGNPRGGLELIDVTNVNDPVEIGLISHIGHAHTTNVDPKRPHIAFDVTSDTVGVSCNSTDTSCTRSNGLALDGFEVADLSSCMNFEPLTSVDVKRMLCRPQVYRYRYESPLLALGHSVDALSGCHELEMYPDDKLTCASINASIVFDLSGAFDDRGTPDDYTDDKPRGTPLPCVVRDSRTMGPFATTAKVTDCVDRNPAAPGNDLDLASYTAPSLEGVVHLGTAFHQGRGGANDSTQDIDVSHEAELSGSGRLLLVTDERGGGVSPPGASCVTSPGDVPTGNGGIHAYRVDALLKTTPSGSDNTAARNAAWTSYAQKPGGGKAIYRAPINTGPQASLCTSHVFHQIPGQNRIFMGWYTQGTQVVDFVEHEDGTVEFKQVGYFIPPHANTWTSAVFKMKKNADGTFTYWGATGDFSLGAAGRSAVDIWKVTLPAPPEPLLPTAKPDLLVESITAANNKNVREGQKVTITATIHNAGAGAAPVSTTEFLLDGATILGLAATEEIPAGESRTVSVDWDTRGVRGGHTITVTADRVRTVDESDEDNNSKSVDVTVQGNKVKNPSFEQANESGNGPEAWEGDSTGAGSATWSDGSSDGAKSASVTGNGGNAALAGSPSWTSAPIAVVPGETLELVASVSALGASSPAGIGLVYLGGAGQVLDTVRLLSAPLTTVGFQQLQQTLTIPAGVSTVRVVLTGFAPTDVAAAGTVAFDDIGLYAS